MTCQILTEVCVILMLCHSLWVWWNDGRFKSMCTTFIYLLKLTQYNKHTHTLNTYCGSWSPLGFLSDRKEAVHFDLLGVKSACEQEEEGFIRVSCSVGQISSPHKMSLHLLKFLVTKCGTLWSFEATGTTQSVKHRAPNFVSLLSKFYIHCFLEQ